MGRVRPWRAPAKRWPTNRKEGLDLLHDHSQYEDGSVSVEAGLMDMLIRMEAGRFKVFDHLLDWWEEFRLYHRRDGKIHKERDDVMSATRYAIMMLRYARVGNPKPFIMPRPSGRGWMSS
jgi:hypothetical protein